ncbi:alpha/beta fold hydrolase [Nocardioides coralli]|uniref:alpha/beta fold hydrolase n=1 Tax=Nocardioides coralli TaxID=2872154 RepID=UPI001CA3F83B|nr:alpha/beta fold hydrolase [Nocardioides coralli]QZY29886.1 alpha/beta fold hydrolase [Nocardioides coralli]
MTTGLVLPSPFLGPAVYAWFATALTELGVPTRVATYDGPPEAGRLVEQWSRQAADLRDAVLVAHSNAGLLAPLVAHAVAGCRTVFVDAALPADEGRTALAPPPLRRALADIADADGLLPPWTRWWSQEELTEVLPEPWSGQVGPLVPRVPLSYVEATVDLPAGWAGGRCAYLALGATTYAAEIERAGDLGWPVSVLPHAGHLHVVVAPHETATAVVDLAERL